MHDAVLLEMKHILKRFPGVLALDGASLELKAGEVHALLGENGAGKSTLIKILGGIYSMDEGEIRIEGKPVTINTVDDAKDNCISIIHQELVLVPYLTVAENIFLGREPRKRGLVDFGKMYADTARMLTEYGLQLEPEALVANLTIAQQQMVEIVKAISFHAKIIVMDEPTSSLADKEVEALFNNIRQLTAQGIGIIYISHRMSELEIIADRVTVMRDGKNVGTKRISETTNDELIAMMVGRSMDNYYIRTFNECKETVLRVENLCSDKIHDVSFELKKGEILGFSGLMGAGRSETMKAIFGIDRITGGTIELEGKPIAVKNAAQMIQAGISLVPENRRDESIIPVKPVRFNLTLKVLHEFIRGVFVNDAREREISSKYIRSLSVRTPGDETEMRSLSGGNQQKVVIGSWLATNPKVLILDEPTRGVDVGAKSEIYMIMNELAKQGVSIIMVSSELPEVLNMSDRVAVMCDGTITKILDRSEATQEIIMRHAVKL